MPDVMPAYLAGDYEPAVAGLIAERVKPGMTAAVVGAHWGHFAAQLLDIGCAVYAFEPEPANFARLVENCPAAHCFEIAGWDEDRDDLHLFLDPENSGNHSVAAWRQIHAREYIEVKARRLEALVPALDFALVDAQAADHRVIAGLGKRRPPLAVVEHWQEGLAEAGFDADEVLAGYADFGYTATRLDSLNWLLERA